MASFGDHARWARYTDNSPRSLAPTQYFDGSQELYDHKQDPREWNNLIQDPEYTNISQWLSNKLPQILTTNTLYAM